jgi:nitrogen-specific signal transduction histidine kinase/TolB-like protein/ActR/RegA family two-component response regulator
LRRLAVHLEAQVEARSREAKDAQRDAQAKLLQAQKMEAVGQLTGGVAHDFNNLLTVVLGNATVLRLKAEARGDAQSARRAELIERAAERGGRLAGQLLAFSRKQILQPENVQVHELLRGIQELLLRAAGEQIRLGITSADDLWSCHVDPTQLESAVLNLVLNARDAMPLGVGTIAIRCANEAIEDARAQVLGGVPGDYVRVDVADTGSGIGPELLEKVFEPFFTTKELGKGSGLGLAQVHGFVGQSGGFVDLQSELGRGTTVSLYLPRAAGRGASRSREPEAAPAHGLGRTILLVENQAELRETVTSTLEYGGYRVTAVSDGTAARALLATDEPIDVLFADMGLPGTTGGIELAHAARRIRPDILVLLASGDASDASKALGADLDFDVIGKPYRPDDLLRVLGGLLRDSAVRSETEALLAEVRDRTRPASVSPAADAAERLARGARGRTIRLGVMPFRLIEPRPEHDLSLGLAEEITSALSRFRWISCVASASLAAIDAEPVGETLRWRKLDLDFLLDGTFQSDRGRIRIMARLLDMRASGEVLWAQAFNHDISDLLSLQEQIAAETAAQVGPAVLLREGERAAARPQISATSHELVLRAIPAIYRLDEGGFRQAGEWLEEALRVAPENASAHAWLAHWHLFLVGQGWAHDPHGATRRAGYLAARAIALDPADARCVTVAGHIRGFLHHQAEEAVSLHERALSINPNLALAWCFSGLAHCYLGEHAAAVRRVRHARHLSPYDPHGFFFDTALMLPLMLSGEYEAAADAGRNSIELNPSFSSAYKVHLASLGRLGRTEEAARSRTGLFALEPDFTITKAIERSPLRRPEDLAHYADGLKRAGVPE